MSRWAPIPTAVGSSLAVAELSPPARCVWLALRVAHATHGQGGVLPPRVASTRGLPLAVPALVAGIDVADALAELARAGLTRPHDDGLALADWDVEGEQAPCSRCRRRNPDPRHAVCPPCRARDADPTRLAQRREQRRAADPRRTPDGPQTRSDDRRAQQPRGLASNGEATAQTDPSSGADWSRPRPDPTRPDRPYSNHQRRAGARETPAPPAGEPIRPQNALAARQKQSPTAGDVRAVAGAWAVAMTKQRGIERMLPAIHAADVVRLLAEVGTDPPHVRDPDALARDRREAARRIIAWCPSPERLARWCVVAVRRYRASNVAGYLRRAAEGGDPGTMLARNGQGEGALPPVVEGALRGEHAQDVQRLVAGGAATRDADATDAERVRLRAQLAAFLGSGRRDAAKRVLLRLVGADRSDVALARAVDGVLTLEQAKGLLAA
jgi:hypothetical protein